MVKCTSCSKEFKSQMGVNLHHLRMHTAVGKSWKTSSGKRNQSTIAVQEIQPRKTRTSRTLNVRERIREALIDFPDGASLNELMEVLHKKGYKSVTGRSYVVKMASQDGEIRNNSGKFILKTPPTKMEVLPMLEIPREALLLQIEMLRSTVRALSSAHIGVVQEIVRNA